VWLRVGAFTPYAAALKGKKVGFLIEVKLAGQQIYVAGVSRRKGRKSRKVNNKQNNPTSASYC